MYAKQIWKTWQWGIGRTVAATIAAHGNSISVGMCQGYSAVLLPQLMQPETTLPVTADEASWIASLGVISNPIGALLAGALMEIFGRKTTVKLTSLPYVIGWVLISLSDNILKLYSGRFITGVAVGMATASYVYVAEISPADHRGILSASGPVHVSLGVLAVYILGFILHWQRVAAVCTLCALLSFLGMCAVPESAPWLAAHGRTKEAKDALLWLRRNPATADAELLELLNDSKKDLGRLITGTEVMTLKSHIKPFLRPSAWKPFVILLLFFAFQEGSGIYIILYYAVNLFQEVGSGLNEYVASIVVGGMRLVMSIVGAMLIRSYGRRTLAMTSGFGMAIAMVVGGTYEYLYDHLPSSERPMIWIPLICVLLHVCVSMIGFLQLPWVMNGELFPLPIRGVMGGLVASLAHLFIFASVKTYSDLMHALGADGTLWMFGAAAFAGAIYCYLFLPETRNKTLREIEEAFSSSPYIAKKSKANICAETNAGRSGYDNRGFKNDMGHAEAGNVRTNNTSESNGNISNSVFSVEQQYENMQQR